MPSEERDDRKGAMPSKPVKRRIFSAVESGTYGRKLTVYTVDWPDGSRSYEFETAWPGSAKQTVTISQNDMDTLVNEVE